MKVNAASAEKLVATTGSTVFDCSLAAESAQLLFYNERENKSWRTAIKHPRVENEIPPRLTMMRLSVRGKKKHTHTNTANRYGYTGLFKKNEVISVLRHRQYLKEEFSFKSLRLEMEQQQRSAQWSGCRFWEEFSYRVVAAGGGHMKDF